MDDSSTRGAMMSALFEAILCYGPDPTWEGLRGRHAEGAVCVALQALLDSQACLEWSQRGQHAPAVLALRLLTQAITAAQQCSEQPRLMQNCQAL